MTTLRQAAQQEPSVAQLNAILDGLGVVAHGRQSAREFLRVWIRDWTMHKVAQALAQQEPDLRNANPIGLTPPQKALQQAQFRAAALAQEEQEPVARVIDDETPEGSTEWIPYSGRQVPVKTGDLLYTHPPRHEWQSLSEDELTALGVIHSRYQEESLETGGWFDFARAVEAALKEKNNG